MNDLLLTTARHGYALIFGILIAESVGFPFPAPIALVAAGAGIASHTLSGYGVFIAAILALIAGDTLAVLAGTLHRVGLARISLPPFHEPGDLHAAFGGILL